jgi:hypothetical protein
MEMKKNVVRGLDVVISPLECPHLPLTESDLRGREAAPTG